MSWSVSGSYFEACNCDAICPCRMVDGVPGGRSTYGECLGVLSWLVEDGHADDVRLDGLAVAMVCRYHDDEPGSPWTIVLHVDERGDDFQRVALERIYLGAMGGDRISKLPWIRKARKLAAVRASRIEIVADGRARTLRVGDGIEVAASRPVEDHAVRCGIPGYEQPGYELVADVNRVDAAPFSWEFSGRCAFVSRFDYAGAPG